MLAKRFVLSAVSALLLCGLLAGLRVPGARALVGDLDVSGSVAASDLAIIDAAYGTRSAVVPLPLAWDWRADINRDAVIDLSDLALAGRSFASDFNFHFQRRTSNGRDGNPRLTGPFWSDAVADAAGRLHVIWQEATTSETPLFYTLLDPSGNPLIEDVEISPDGDAARLAVGPDLGAHIVFKKRFSNSGLYYIRLDAQGRVMTGSTMLPGCGPCSFPNIAVDAYNHAHIVYQKPMYQALYTILGDSGGALLPVARLNPGSQAAANAYAIAVSPDGARHILWRQATGTAGGELRYTRIDSLGTVTVTNLAVAVLQGAYNDRRYFLSADSHSSVHFLYADNRGDPGAIYWRRADPDGSLSPEKRITTNGVASAGLDVSYAIGPSDLIHLVAPWKADGGLAYARLDRDGNILVPFQRVAFTAMAEAALTVDGQGRASLVAPSRVTDSTGGRPLFVVSTVADPAANDPARADLVLDLAHLSTSDPILKINESADITVTLTNGGPLAASGVNLAFSYPDLAGATGVITVPVADLDPYRSVSVRQVIPVPDFEQVDSWEVTVSASTRTTETTTSNNQVVAAFGVIPPPRMFNLEVLAYDETFATADRSQAEPLSGGRLDLSCPLTGQSQVITSTQFFNVVWDLPLEMSPANAPLYPTTCTVQLSKPGFSTASAPVTARRYSVANPYPIVLSPPRPLELYINTWGGLAGVVSSEGVPLINAQLRLDTGITTTTSAGGAYSFDKVPAGSHTLRVWARGHTPIPAEPVSVAQGQVTPHNISMQATERAYVAGYVLNEYSQPLDGATVKFFGDAVLIDQIVTLDDGAFDFSIEPFSQYTAYHLEVTRSGYDLALLPLPALYPGLPLDQDVSMTYTATGGDLQVNGQVTSWVQDERWCKSYASDEDLPLRLRILQKIGSKWCPSFQTVVNWGKYDYNLGLIHTASGSDHQVTELLIDFSNWDFISYDVSSGRWHSGGESRSVTAERVDWIELLAIDSAGNPQAVPVWHDGTVWYSSEQSDPASAFRRLQVNTAAPAWSLAGIRVFYTIGQYAPGEQHNFKDWAPPADLGLAGSGAPSGANRQVLTWWLATNTVEMRYALADYRSALHPNGAPGGVPSGLSLASLPAYPASPALPDASIVALVGRDPAPARLGTPLVVDLTLDGFDTRPAYGVEFDLAFNTQYLRLVSLQGGLDFAGPRGVHARSIDISAANAAGKITNAAVVRLAAESGLVGGRAARLVFMPIKKTPTGSSTRLDLQAVVLADLDSDLFSPGHVVDMLTIVVADARVYLPRLSR